MRSGDSHRALPAAEKNALHGSRAELSSRSKIVTRLEFDDFSTGLFGRGFPGLVIQLVSQADGELYYCVFNVELRRKRNSRHGAAGSKLPGKQFRVSKRHAFYKFWLQTGLPLPVRLSSFHDYMGNLRKLIFEGETVPYKPNRLIATSLSSVNLVNTETPDRSSELFADSMHTTSKQTSDICQTSPPYKDCRPTHTARDLEGNLSTGLGMHKKKLTRTKESREQQTKNG